MIGFKIKGRAYIDSPLPRNSISQEGYELLDAYGIHSYGDAVSLGANIIDVILGDEDSSLMYILIRNLGNTEIFKAYTFS